MLTEKEIQMVMVVAAGKSLKPLGSSAYRAFNDAMRKIRLGTGEHSGVLPEGECEYDISWVKSHQQEAIDLANRHQSACIAAHKLFWEIRRGMSRQDA
ncbi:MAG: hypothetical protein EHM62_08385 [Methylococcus sp.]|nr:MAG: hypothetical protein EHM62_08385 [Methylococcus sp.]